MRRARTQGTDKTPDPKPNEVLWLSTSPHRGRCVRPDHGDRTVCIFPMVGG